MTQYHINDFSFLPTESFHIKKLMRNIDEIVSEVVRKLRSKFSLVIEKGALMVEASTSFKTGRFWYIKAIISWYNIDMNYTGIIYELYWYIKAIF